MWISRAIAQRGFPAPIHLGGRDRFWRLEDLQRWDRTMIERGPESMPVPPPRSKAVRP